MGQSLTGSALENTAFRGVLARRILAFAIDLSLILVLGWACAIAIFVVGVLTLGLGFLLFHFIPLMPLVYCTLLLPRGGTLGQRLCGLEPRQEFDLASRPTQAEAFVWGLLLAVSLAFAGLPLLVAFTNPRRRAAHDVLCGLVVVRV